MTLKLINDFKSLIRQAIFLPKFVYQLTLPVLFRGGLLSLIRVIERLRNREKIGSRNGGVMHHLGH